MRIHNAYMLTIDSPNYDCAKCVLISREINIDCNLRENVELAFEKWKIRNKIDYPVRMIDYMYYGEIEIVN